MLSPGASVIQTRPERPVPHRGRVLPAGMGPSLRAVGAERGLVGSEFHPPIYSPFVTCDIGLCMASLSNLPGLNCTFLLAGT